MNLQLRLWQVEANQRDWQIWVLIALDLALPFLGLFQLGNFMKAAPVMQLRESNNKDSVGHTV
jgi:hypothetical protein